jgi:hypothetical protein
MRSDAYDYMKFVLLPLTHLYPSHQAFDSIQTFIPADANGQLGTQSLSCYLSTCVGSLIVSGSDHVPARTYSGPSPALELAKIPLPRLALFFVC